MARSIRLGCNIAQIGSINLTQMPTKAKVADIFAQFSVVPLWVLATVKN
jgi:hypothetical protein